MGGKEHFNMIGVEMPRVIVTQGIEPDLRVYGRSVFQMALLA